MIAKTNHLKALVVLAAAALAASLLALVAAGEPAQAAFSGENGKIAFLSDRDGHYTDEIYVTDESGANPVRLTNDPEKIDGFPAASPNGKDIAFIKQTVGDHTVTTGFDIYVMKAEPEGATNVPINLTESASLLWLFNARVLSWSPDGNKIAFTKTDTGQVLGNYDLYVMNVKDHSETRLTYRTSSERGAVFSPDGNKIAFQSGRTGGGDIYVLDAKDEVNNETGAPGPDGKLDPESTTNVPTQITTNARQDSYPTWSPDGTKIAFASNRDGDYDIYVMKAEPESATNVPVNLTDDRVDPDTSIKTAEVHPSWSPDGTKIAFWSAKGDDNPLFYNGSDIWVMNAKDGSQKEDVTKNEVTDIQPDWGPLADTTPPDITVPSDISQTATSSSGNQVTFDAPTATDTVDGTITPTCDHNSGDTFPLATTTVTCTATDKAGNTSTKSFNVTITYAWSDVLQPINSDDSSVFKLGSVVPVKFQLTEDSASITDASAKLYIAQVSGDVTGTEQEATSNASADSGNTFRYDSTNKQYVFNLATKNLSAGTWQLRIDLGDGVKHTVNISFKS